MSAFKYGGGLIFPACPPNFVKCEGCRSLVVEVTGDLSGWQTVEITYFMTPTLDFSPSLSLCLSLTLVLTGFLISYVFSTCMPHYILKVNPINTEITLEDFFLALLPLHGALSSFFTSGDSYSNFIHSDKADSQVFKRNIGLKQRTNEGTEKCADLYNPFEMYIILRFVPHVSHL